MSHWADSLLRNCVRPLNTPHRLYRVAEPLFWLTGHRHLGRPQSPPAKLLVIKLDRLGDLILCSGLLRDVRSLWPAARITLFVRDSLVELARRCPAVDSVIGVSVLPDEVMTYDAASGNYRQWDAQMREWIDYCQDSRIWRERFDLAIVPRWGPDYYGATVLAFLSGAPRRWGTTEHASAWKAKINRDFDRLLTNVVPGRLDKHEVLLNTSLAEAMGERSASPRLASWTTPQDLQAARQLLKEFGIGDDRHRVALCMGAGAAQKQWPVERYAALCRNALDLRRVQLVTTGTPHELRLGRELRQLVGDAVVNTEGRLPLSLLPAFVAQCVLYIGSDTGTMHMASTAGVPVFAVSCHPRDGDANWPEAPGRFGPWGIPYRMVQPSTGSSPCSEYCAACQPHCILGVSVDDATRELLAFLAETGLTSCRL